MADSPQERVPDSDLDYDGELIFRHHGVPFTGIGFEDIPGKWLSEVSYLGGYQHGPARDFYPSGALKSEAHYFENSLHGLCRDYSENGAVLKEELFEHAIGVRRIRRDSSGQVIEDWRIDPEGSTYPLLQKYRRKYHWPTVG